MKFLDVDRLNAVTTFLDTCYVGDRRLRGRVEAYSCKPAGDDKKLAKVLEQQIKEDCSYGETSSPLGRLDDPQTRKLLVNLICTMNATFPDYDFSALKADHFVRENLGMVINHVNVNLSEIVEKQNGNFLEELWGAIDQEIFLKDSEVYSYVPNMEDDPFTLPGSVWSFNHFFYNRALKKLVFLTCCCTMSGVSSGGADIYGTDQQHAYDDEDAYGGGGMDYHSDSSFDDEPNVAGVMHLDDDDDQDVDDDLDLDVYE